MWFNNKKDSYIISMPGVPFEMKSMFVNHILPSIKNLTDSKVFIYRTIMTTGMGESWLADSIRNWEQALPKNVRLAYLPKPGIVRLRLSAEGDDAEEINNLDKYSD
jgi:nicotinamide-nucleotide amidase